MTTIATVPSLGASASAQEDFFLSIAAFYGADLGAIADSDDLFGFLNGLLPADSQITAGMIWGEEGSGGIRDRMAILNDRVSFLAALYRTASPGVFTPGLFFCGSRASMWSDDAATVPATVGGAVAFVTGQSPDARSLRQTTAGRRPILREQTVGGRTLRYLEGDGVDDALGTNNPLDLTGVGAVTHVQASRVRATPAATTILMNHNGLTSPFFELRAANAPNTVFSAGSGNSGSTNNPLTLNAARVTTGQVVLASDTLRLRINRDSWITGTVDFTGTAFASATYNLLARTTAGLLPATADIFGDFLIGRQLTDAQLRAVEAVMAWEAGVTL